MKVDLVFTLDFEKKLACWPKNYYFIRGSLHG